MNYKSEKLRARIWLLVGMRVGLYVYRKRQKGKVENPEGVYMMNVRSSDSTRSKGTEMEVPQ